MTQRELAVGSLVRVRGRDWIVLPSTAQDVLNLKPITGAGDTAVGLFLPLEGEGVKPASFPTPDPDVVGDPTAGRLLLDAARLLLRSSTAPFRCAGRLSFRPRPYQFLPLILALKLEPVRLLVADDVGVGKTIRFLRVTQLNVHVFIPPKSADVLISEPVQLLRNILGSALWRPNAGADARSALIRCADEVVVALWDWNETEGKATSDRNWPASRKHPHRLNKRYLVELLV